MNNGNQTQPPVRSTFVTVVAGIFIALSGISTLVSAAQNLMFRYMFPAEQMQKSLELARQSGAMNPLSEYIFNHMQLVVGAFLVVSLLTLVSSIALLLRKNWARLMFMSILVLMIAWNIGSLYFQKSMMGNFMAPPPGTPAEFQSQMASMMQVFRIISYVISVVFIVLFAWIIKRLLSPAIRSEFTSNE